LSKQIFPNLADAFRILFVPQGLIKYVGINAGRCCSYDDLEKYRRYDNVRYLSADLERPYMQSYKYFQSYRNQLVNYYFLFRQIYIDAADDLLKQIISIDDLRQRFVNVTVIQMF
jgi:hypothetical protein